MDDPLTLPCVPKCTREGTYIYISCFRSSVRPSCASVRQFATVRPRRVNQPRMLKERKKRRRKEREDSESVKPKTGGGGGFATGGGAMGEMFSASYQQWEKRETLIYIHSDIHIYTFT